MPRPSLPVAMPDGVSLAFRREDHVHFHPRKMHAGHAPSDRPRACPEIPPAFVNPEKAPIEVA
ncbi:hypothetical protein GCM10025793_22730 [Lysobacter lycopersici]